MFMTSTLTPKTPKIPEFLLALWVGWVVNDYNKKQRSEKNGRR